MTRAFCLLLAGKKCTYGHKCKFYHPERGNQPQRAVADELRASAKISSVTSRGLLEDALMGKTQSSSKQQEKNEVELIRGLQKKQPKPCPKSTFTDLQEDRPDVRSKLERYRGSSSRISRTFSSLLGHPAPGGPPSLGSIDRWEHAGQSGLISPRGAGASGSSQADVYNRCDSPDQGYSSLIKPYSNLSLVVPQSPECFFPADLRAGSLLSDCSSEGSVSSDSFSPDPMLEDGPKFQHHHHHSHHHHHCSGQFAQAASRVPPGLGQRLPHPVPQALQRQYGFGLDNPPSSVGSHASPRSFKTHFQHPPMNSFAGEYPAYQPQTSTIHSHSQSSPLRHSPRSSLWQEGGLQDSRVYEGSPLHSRRSYSGLNQQPHNQTNWEAHYQQPPKPCYDMFTFQSHQDVLDKAWHSPWGRRAHSSPRGLSASSLPPLPQLSFPSITSHKSHLPLLTQQQDPSSFSRYQDVRQRLFVNLCGIFPADLVRTVMTRFPHVMDAQELAAAILMEKSQCDPWVIHMKWNSSFCRFICCCYYNY